MERTIQDYRDVLKTGVVSDNNNVSFQFKSKHEQNPNLWIMEEDKNTGEVTVVDLVNNKNYFATYELKEYHGRHILQIKFQDFKLNHEGFNFSATQGTYLNNFDEVIKALKKEFPPFN